jgi:CheY-like chemotaxis protein
MLSKCPQILVVEDEPLISMMIEEMVVDLGWEIVGSVHTEYDAIAALDVCAPTLAILDINIGPTTSLAVAALCKMRGVPIVFTTGYIARDIPEACGSAPVLAKPFSKAELASTMQRAFAQACVLQRPSLRGRASRRCALRIVKNAHTDVDYGAARGVDA